MVKIGGATLEEVSPYFHLPIEVAARELGVCSSALKRRCRRLGIKRWPFRKVRSMSMSLSRTMEGMCNAGAAPPNMSAPYLQPEAATRIAARVAATTLVQQETRLLRGSVSRNSTLCDASGTEGGKTRRLSQQRGSEAREGCGGYERAGMAGYRMPPCDALALLSSPPACSAPPTLVLPDIKPSAGTSNLTWSNINNPGVSHTGMLLSDMGSRWGELAAGGPRSSSRALLKRERSAQPYGVTSSMKWGGRGSASPWCSSSSNRPSLPLISSGTTSMRLPAQLPALDLSALVMVPSFLSPPSSKILPRRPSTTTSITSIDTPGAPSSTTASVSMSCGYAAEYAEEEEEEEGPPADAFHCAGAYDKLAISPATQSMMEGLGFSVHNSSGGDDGEDDGGSLGEPEAIEGEEDLTIDLGDMQQQQEEEQQWQGSQLGGGSDEKFIFPGEISPLSHQRYSDMLLSMSPRDLASPFVDAFGDYRVEAMLHPAGLEASSEAPWESTTPHPGLLQDYDKELTLSGASDLDHQPPFPTHLDDPSLSATSLLYANSALPVWNSPPGAVALPQLSLPGYEGGLFLQYAPAFDAVSSLVDVPIASPYAAQAYWGMRHFHGACGAHGGQPCTSAPPTRDTALSFLQIARTLAPSNSTNHTKHRRPAAYQSHAQPQARSDS